VVAVEEGLTIVQQVLVVLVDMYRQALQ